jgi:phytochrome-interacting factor 3
VLQASTNRLRSTPLFSEQRMAWLQPPKDSCATVAPVPPPPPPTPPVPIRQGEASAAFAQRVQPEARAALERAPPQPPATATTSSVCSDNVDRSQLKRNSSSHQAPEWSVSQEDEVSYGWSPSRTIDPTSYASCVVHNLTPMQTCCAVRRILTMRPAG